MSKRKSKSKSETAPAPDRAEDLLANLPPGFLLVGSLTISFPRGTARNRADDLGLDASEVQETKAGLTVRGLGSHWTSAEAQVQVTLRLREQSAIRDAFRRRFPAGPYQGTFLLGDNKDEGRRFLDSLTEDLTDEDGKVTGTRPRSELWRDLCLSAYVSVDVIASVSQAPQRLQEWAGRLDNQLAKVPLGRGQTVGDQGVGILRSLIECPVISEEARKDLSGLLEAAALGNVKRVDFQRRLADLSVSVDVPTLGQVVRPRRVPISPTPAPVEGKVEALPVVAPRHRRRRPPLAG